MMIAQTPSERVARRSGVALWRQVAARLAEQIKARGALGDEAGRLPSEVELARTFGVNRHTIRQALRALADQGLVRAEQGRGTFIADIVVDYPLGARTRLTASLEAQERVPSRHLLEIKEVLATDELATVLALARGQSVHILRTLAYADGVPLNISLVHLPAARFPDAGSRLAEDVSITRLFTGYGIADYRRRSTRVHARLPEPHEALLLRQMVSAPVIVTEGIDVDPDDQPVAWVLTVWAADRVQFLVGD